MQIWLRVTVKCPQEESQRKIPETERHLKRFQFLVCFWRDSCQALSPGVRAIHLQRYPSICSVPHWRHLRTQEHKTSCKKTEHFYCLMVFAPRVSMSECFCGTPTLQSGTNEKERAKEFPTCPALWERGSVAALKSLGNDWEKMTAFCSKTWNKISSAASLSLHFSTVPVTGSVGTGWIYSLASGATLFGYFKLKQLLLW